MGGFVDPDIASYVRYRPNCVRRSPNRVRSLAGRLKEDGRSKMRKNGGRRGEFVGVVYRFVFIHYESQDELDHRCWIYVPVLASTCLQAFTANLLMLYLWML